MNKRQSEVIHSLVEALRGHAALIEDAARSRDVRRAVADLQAVKYFATRGLEVLTSSPQADLDAVAQGPLVKPAPRINGPEFRQLLLSAMTGRHSVTPRDLAVALESRGVRIPGKGESANIIIHLRRLIEEGLVDKGVYGEYALTPRGEVAAQAANRSAAAE